MLVLLLSGCLHTPGATSAPTGSPTPAVHREKISPLSTADIEAQCGHRLLPRDLDFFTDAQEAYLFTDGIRLVRAFLRYPQTAELFEQDRRYTVEVAAASNRSVWFGEAPAIPPPAYIVRDTTTGVISLRLLKGPVALAITTGAGPGSGTQAGSAPACTPEQLVELAKIAYGRI